MTKSLMMPVIGGAIAVAALGLAGAADAHRLGHNCVPDGKHPAGWGFHVILNKVGTAPLEQCVVSAVRPGQTYSRIDSERRGRCTTSSPRSRRRPCTWTSNVDQNGGSFGPGGGSGGGRQSGGSSSGSSGSLIQVQ